MKKTTKYLLLGAAAYGAYYFYKKNQAIAVPAPAMAVPATPLIATAQPVPPSLGPGAASSAPSPAQTYGTLSGTCFSSKRGMGIL